MAGNYAVELLLKARDRASNAISGVRTRLRRVGTQAERTDSRIRRLGRGVRSVGRGLRGLSGGLLRSVTRGFGRLAARAGALSSLLAGGLGIYALQRTFRNAISSAGDFEQQLARVEAVSGANERQMERLRAEANRLGQETSFTATQAAQGLEELSRTGFSTEESIASIESTLSLAQSQGMELGRAAEIASDALKGFGMEARETGRMSDVMAAASQEANTNVERLGTALSYAGPTARSANMSLEETVATISALQDAGIQGERAGTQLRAILQQIRDPGTKAAEALRQMGVDTSSLTSIIDGLNNAGPEASKAINAFTRESRTAVRVLMDRGGEDLNAFTEDLRNSQGTAARTAETMQDTLQGALQRLGSAWDALRRKLVSPLLGPIRREVEALAVSFQRFTESRGMESLRTALVHNFRRGARAVREFVSQFRSDQIGQVLTSWVNGAARAVKAIWNGFQWLGKQISSFWDFLNEDDRFQRYAQAVVAAIRWVAGQVRNALDLIREAMNPERLGFGEWLSRQGERAYGVLRTIAQVGVQIYDVFRRVGAVFRGVVSLFVTGGSRIVQTTQTIRSWMLKLLKPMSHVLDLAGKIQSLIPGQEGFGGFVDRINEMVSDAQESADYAKRMAEAANQATREEFGKAFSERPELGMPKEPPWSDWEAPDTGAKDEDEKEEEKGRDEDSTREEDRRGLEDSIKTATREGARDGASEGAKEGSRDGVSEGAQDWEPTTPEGDLSEAPDESHGGSGPDEGGEESAHYWDAREPSDHYWDAREPSDHYWDAREPSGHYWDSRDAGDDSHGGTGPDEGGAADGAEEGEGAATKALIAERATAKAQAAAQEKSLIAARAAAKDQDAEKDASETEDEDEGEEGSGIQLDGGQATQSVERGVERGNKPLREETGRLTEEMQRQRPGGERSELIAALHEATRQGDIEAVREATRALQALRRNEQRQRQDVQSGSAQQRPSRVTRIEIGDSDGGTRAEMDVPEEQADRVLSALEEAGGRVADG